MQNNKRVKVERRAVSLYPNDWSTVDGYGEILGISASAALRAIIRQWKRSQGQTNVPPVITASSGPLVKEQ